MKDESYKIGARFKIYKINIRLITLNCLYKLLRLYICLHSFVLFIPVMFISFMIFVLDWILFRLIWLLTGFTVLGFLDRFDNFCLVIDKESNRVRISIRDLREEKNVFIESEEKKKYVWQEV
jgi:hypothetical protein